MILYFTGTGNSRYTARKLGELLNDEVVSLNDYIKDGRRGDFHSETPYVFVAPTYAWQLPRVMQKLLLASRFEGSRDAYFVLTCGDGVCNAEHYLKALSSRLNLKFRGLMPVIMPENYIALYPVPGKEEADHIIMKAGPVIIRTANLIKTGQSFPANIPKVIDRIQSGPVNRLFYSLVVSDKGFRVTDACISCGKCEKLCPVNDVKLKEGKPVWGGDCTNCMACICGCPTEAIEYKKKSVGQPRYYLD